MPTLSTTPIFIRQPHVQWQNVISVANATVDGTNATWERPLFTANSQNGSYVEYIKIKTLGTGGVNSVRLFLNNGGVTTQANNNAFIHEIGIPQLTWSETAALWEQNEYIRLSIPPNYNLYATVPNTINSFITVTAVGGHYGNLPGASEPLFIKQPRIESSNVILTQNQTRTAATGPMRTVFTANAINGSFLDYIKAKAHGTNAVSVARIFLNNGFSNTAISNNVLFTEVTLPATTISETAGLTEIAIPMKLGLNPGYNVLVSIGTTVAAGWNFTSFGGDY